MLADCKGLSASSSEILASLLHEVLEGGHDLEERVFRQWEWRLNKCFDLHMHFALHTVSFHPHVPVYKDHELSSLLVGWRLGGRSQRNRTGMMFWRMKLIGLLERRDGGSKAGSTLNHLTFTCQGNTVCRVTSPL